MSTAALTVDFKKNRIRLHKDMLHRLGDPEYVQLLVNPSKMVVAIRCIEYPFSHEPVHRVTIERMQSYNSYEIYSQSFLMTLSELVPEMHNHTLFRLSGEIIPAEKLALFPLSSLRKIDVTGGSGHDGNATNCTKN